MCILEYWDRPEHLRAYQACFLDHERTATDGRLGQTLAPRTQTAAIIEQYIKQ